METHSFDLSVFDQLRSKRNRLFFQLRKQIGFTRDGYRESGAQEIIAAWQASLPKDSQNILADLEAKYHLATLQSVLRLESWQKNLATLWILEQFPELQRISAMPFALEAGAHDFQRAPALLLFLHSIQSEIRLHGIELDAYRVLHDFHSRADRAQYFSRLVPGASYESADFFSYRSEMAAGFFFAFYPFVSPHPALAWGLPAEFGNAANWVNSIHRNLHPDGLALIMHQGKWEEEEFDAALAKNPGKFILLARRHVDCPFYPTPHPPHASLYARARS